MDQTPHQKELERRSLAIEGALILLIGDLATRGVVSADEAEEALKLISGSCDFSAARASSAVTLVRQLRRLRRNDGSSAPGSSFFEQR
ncbi:MAG TPA: hypothetical protein VM468_07630 [Mycoplana sp.]|jgi:hypothetical protein|nr:hypothetical protein [Mycoplana sp.]